MALDPNELVRDAWAKKEYRPVAVAMIYDDMHKRIILVQSVKKGHDWSCPQGGIDQGETAENALFREIKEELNLDRENLSLLGYLGAEDLDAPSGRADKRGFTKGKRYFFFALSWNGRGVLKMNKKELRGYVWARNADVPRFLASLRADKKALLFKFLTILLAKEESLLELRKGLKPTKDDF